MDSLRRIVRALGASARTLPDGGGVSGAQLFVLRQINAAPGLSIGELAARTLAGQSTVSEVVSRLIDAGLVSRRASTSDARQAKLTLTARGRGAIRDTELTAQERLTAGLGSLSGVEREALATGLEQWLASAGLAELPATMFFEHRRAARHGSTALSRPRSAERA
jgi:DNA-binding MarR family transcriptional regulator